VPKPKPEPKPEPEPKPKPTPKPEPRSGEKLAIPADAAQNNDLSFLKGCWVAANTTCNGRQITEEYCFNATGGGARSIYDEDGVFSGPLRARFDSRGNLIINISRAPNTRDPNNWYSPEYVKCSGAGGDMNCQARVLEEDEGCQYKATYYRK
jgi:hypothetical protein